MTMDPAPTPGNHGHHQMAARLAVEAFTAAADPSALPLADHGGEARPLARQAPVQRRCGRRVPRRHRAGRAPRPSPRRTARTRRFGAVGRRPRAGRRRRGRRSRARRSASTSPRAGPASRTSRANPRRIGCDRFTQIAARVPYGARSTDRDAMLEGALVPRAGRAAAGHGAPHRAGGVRRRAGRDGRAGRPRARPAAARRAHACGSTSRAGWTGRRDRRGSAGSAPAAMPRRRCASASRATRSPAASASPRTLLAGGRTGRSSALVRDRAPGAGTLQPLPQVADFRPGPPPRASRSSTAWSTRSRRSASGRRARCGSTCATPAASASAGTVALRLPAGFAADAPSKPFAAIPPGGRGSVTLRGHEHRPDLDDVHAGRGLRVRRS